MIVSNSGKDAMLQGLADALSSGTLSLYDASGIVATFIMPNPIGSVADGKITFSFPDAVQATRSGNPTYAKLKDSTGNDVLTLNVGTELILDSSSIFKGGNVSIETLTIQI